MYNKEIFKRCFSYKGIYWFYNFKEIPNYIKQMRFLRKEGFDEYAYWETYDWFIKVMRKILTNYRYNRCGSPVTISGLDTFIPDEKKRDELLEQNNENWNSILDTMLSLLDDMDAEGSPYDDMDYASKRKNSEEAKDSFFKLFSEYFYHFWD